MIFLLAHQSLQKNNCTISPHHKFLQMQEIYWFFFPFLSLPIEIVKRKKYDEWKSTMINAKQGQIQSYILQFLSGGRKRKNANIIMALKVMLYLTDCLIQGISKDNEDNLLWKG